MTNGSSSQGTVIEYVWIRQVLNWNALFLKQSIGSCRLNSMLNSAPSLFQQESGFSPNVLPNLFESETPSLNLKKSVAHEEVGQCSFDFEPVCVCVCEVEPELFIMSSHTQKTQVTNRVEEIFIDEDRWWFLEPIASCRRQRRPHRERPEHIDLYHGAKGETDGQLIEFLRAIKSRLGNSLRLNVTVNVLRKIMVILFRKRNLSWNVNDRPRAFLRAVYDNNGKTNHETRKCCRIVSGF